MKVLRSWLEDYTKISLTNSELAEKLSFSGTLVEAAEEIIDPNIVVGQIKDIKKHPNADKLQIATVYNGIEDLQIVCGAPNIAVGQKVPLAQIGTILPEYEIKKAEIRGIESFGMMCSERELGLGEDHSGIKILPDEFEAGKKVSDYLKSDAIFELEITPNRGDCLSHFGVAREVAAICSSQLKEVKAPNLNQSKQSTINVEVADSDLCLQYHAIEIKGVKVQDSPQWLKNRLIALGQKPINNVVDVTNYILFDLGQPLHAFDQEKITNQIVIRPAIDKEKIKTLDQTEKTLNPTDLVIADSEKAIALAGVMGGANSEVDINTTNIVLEGAEFKATNIRKTSKRLGLQTEASYRFERGVDSGLVKLALEKAAELIRELAGGEIHQAASVCAVNEKKTQKIEYEKINNLLGTKLSGDEIDQILNHLGFEIKNGEATIPTWRHDIEIWQDLAEEVGRIYGFEKLPQESIPITEAPKKSLYYYKEAIKDILVENGFVENFSYAFLSEADLEIARINKENILEISNPLQKENKFLRNSLIPGLLKAVAKNPSFDQVFLFETGNVFTKDCEKTNLSLIAAGKDAKNVIYKAIEILAEKLKKDLKNYPIMELPREELTMFKIKKPMCYAWEIEIDQLFAETDYLKSDIEFILPTQKIDYKNVSKYPTVVRDLAFIVEKNIDGRDLTKTIVEASDKVLLTEIFDEFQSEKFGENNKNIAIHLWLQDEEKTISDSEIAEIMELIVNIVEQKFNAKLRA